MRAFVAVELPGLDPTVNWPRPPERHITLRFLGEISEPDAARVAAVLSRVAATTAPFALGLRGGGAFPNALHPRVVWVGVGAGAAELVALERHLSEELAREGFPREERPFVPHVTALRVRSATDSRVGRTLLAALEGRPVGATTVNEVVLFRSELAREGARHTALARLSLGGAPAPAPPSPRG